MIDRFHSREYEHHAIHGSYTALDHRLVRELQRSIPRTGFVMVELSDSPIRSTPRRTGHYDRRITVETPCRARTAETLTVNIWARPTTQ